MEPRGFFATGHSRRQGMNALPRSLLVLPAAHLIVLFDKICAVCQPLGVQKCTFALYGCGLTALLFYQLEPAHYGSGSFYCRGPKRRS
jgi:hypothetical protein